LPGIKPILGIQDDSGRPKDPACPAGYKPGAAPTFFRPMAGPATDRDRCLRV
ncbi:MAG: hypothetical protein QOI40_3902, partial [Alphaproteobacteria bacterium]|nr:hypothetical protein [Alphaproteobacteria bacterium]